MCSSFTLQPELFGGLFWRAVEIMFVVAQQGILLTDSVDTFLSNTELKFVGILLLASSSPPQEDCKESFLCGVDGVEVKVQLVLHALV
jgi:hypothetical protein